MTEADQAETQTEAERIKPDPNGSVPPPLANLPTELRPDPKALLSVGIVTLLVIGYPLVFKMAMAWAGVRGAACLVLVISIGSAVFAQVGTGSYPGVDRLSRAALLGLLAVALTTGAVLPLRMVITVVYLALASIFWRSLRDGGSIIETLVRDLAPGTPDFIRPYCRKTTVLWSGFFLINAVVLTVLAVRGPVEMWEHYSGRVIYSQMGVIFVADFLVRKTWFRYYFKSNPFDRLWSVLFPAENTAQGRRSAAYIHRMKAE